MRNRIEPYRFASCLSIIVVDWLVYASSMTNQHSWFVSWLSATVIGSVATLVVVGIIESRGEGAPRHPIYRGLAGALAVAVPLPVIGTIFGLGALLWSALAPKKPAQVS